MAKRSASFDYGDINTKSARSNTTLADVSTGLSGIYTLTDPVRLDGVYWRNPFYWVCSICRRKVDTKCPFHPGSQSKVHYRLRVFVKQSDVQLWLTAFDGIAVDILGTPASEYDSLDESGRIKLVDSVVGLKLLVTVVKTVKNGFKNVVFAKIDPTRTDFSETIIDSTKPTVL